jgi:lipopolysaccharide assembly protein A
MRLAFILLALLFAMLGALFGALNSESVPLDFYYAQSQFPKGAALLLALLLGWILGGLLVYLSLVPGLRRRVRAQARELKRFNREHAPQVADAGEGKELILRQPGDA